MAVQGSKKNRNIYMSNEKDGEDFVAKLGRDVFDHRAWFFYDFKTHTIRLAKDPTYVLSNKRGKKYKSGHNVVFQKYEPNTQEQYLRVVGHKIQNRANKCLSPHNLKKHDKNTLEFWNCNSN